jgi:hypothetical protein
MSQVHQAKQEAQAYTPARKVGVKTHPAPTMPPQPAPAVALPVFALGEEDEAPAVAKKARGAKDASDKPKRKIYSSHGDCERCNQRKAKAAERAGPLSKFDARVAQEVEAKLAEAVKAKLAEMAVPMETEPPRAAGRSYTGK